MKKRRRIRWDRLALVAFLFSTIVTSAVFGVIKLLSIQKQNRENTEVTLIVDSETYELNADEFIDYKVNDVLPEVQTLQFTSEEINDLARQEFAGNHIEDEFEYLGEFRLTGYCNCEECCGQWAGGPTYSGVMPQSNHTIAVDKDVIPIGSHVLINGVEYVAEDTGSAIIGNHIDIYCDTHEECYSDYCNGYADVYLIKEN